MDYVHPFKHGGKWFNLLPCSRSCMPLMLKCNVLKGHPAKTAMREAELRGFVQCTLNSSGGVPCVNVDRSDWRRLRSGAMATVSC